MDILESYLKKNGCKIFSGKEAVEIYRSNRENFEEICGSTIYDTLDDFMGYDDDNDDNDDIITLIIVNNKGNPISVFYGTIEDNYLSSDYTCSSELPKGGALLRFYALLIANKENNNIQSLTGGISGGIPAILFTDSAAVVNEKRKKLSEYHVKNGAIINDNKFIYNLTDVQVKIVEMFGQTHGGQRRKTKKYRKNKRRKSLKRNAKK
jgi:hypothetical protein